jgi:hypothetical protein
MSVNSSSVAGARKRDGGLKLAVRLAIFVALPALGGCQTSTYHSDDGTLHEVDSAFGIQFADVPVRRDDPFGKTSADYDRDTRGDGAARNRGDGNNNQQGGQSSQNSSDIRLKRDIVEVGRLGNGLHLYHFRYNWADQEYVGVMAQEVLKVVPGAVSRSADGYLRVDYGKLGLRLETWDEWLRQHPRQASRAN